LDWHYRKKSWPHVSDHGSADVDVSLSAAVEIQITTSNGRPVLNVLQDSVNIGELKIHLHGGASWLYQLFINIFSGDIKKAITKALTDAITQNIDKGLNKALATLPISENIGKDAQINFELIGNPVFTSTYMQTPELGEFYARVNPQECPTGICPRTQTPDVINSQMLQMIITDFVANSAGFTFLNLGKLKIAINDSDVPSWSPIRLNTKSFEYTLPALYDKYPNDPLEIVMYCTQAPLGIFTPQGATIEAVGNLEVWVITDGQMIKAFTLDGSATSQGAALLSGTTLSGNLTYLEGNFTLLYSNIGPINVKIFDVILNVLFSEGVIPAVNTILKRGFVLPTVKGLTFINPSLGFGQDFLYVTTDVNYIPPFD